jgi:putative ABC transport system permease protein
MSLTDLVGFAGGALVGHRLRTILSVLGMAVGIAAVVALTALGEGARLYVIREFSAMGSNLLIVLPGKVETTGAMPFGGVTHDLTLEDFRMMESHLPRVRRAAPASMGTETVHFRGKSRSAPILGTTPELMEIRRLRVGSGRFLSESDLTRGGAEVVLGVKVAKELFGAENPLGQAVRIGEWRFRVVGILEPRGRSLGFDMDDLVIVPVQTGMSMFNRSSLFRILVEVRSQNEMTQTRKDLLRFFKDRHRAEDVTVISQDAMLASFSAILQAMTMALAGIASISLVVAGVGIMNVMLVSVTERRAEIGLLKALGAANRQILAVFLTEAVLLASAGGLAGLAVGYTAVRLFVGYYPSFPATPPAWAVLSALVLSLFVGVGFGVWPARRATRLEPVSALRGR